MNSKALTVGVAIIVLAALAYFLTTTREVKDTGVTGPHTGILSQNNQGETDVMNMHPASSATMTGTWKSTEDPKFTRTFKPDGTVTDAYAGDASATETGTYTVVDPLKEPAGAFGAASASSLTGMTILKVVWPKTGVMYSGVQSESDTNLALINLSGRGNILSFTKVK